nr:2,3-bisphosphoglycerate-dependent phosphoglycerate mutase [Cellulomonas sp. APG4]
MRHGESVHNAAQVFTGLLDVGLTERGREQARDAARLLVAHGLRPDVVVTSPMVRTRRTAELVIDAAGLDGVQVESTWRLAERDYGSLTDVPKAVARERYGPDRFITVRRTLDGTPAPASPAQVSAFGPVYREPGSGLPEPGAGESLRDVVGRVRPCWEDLLARVHAGERVLVVGHGNSLRALCTLVDGLAPEEVVDLNLPPAQPLRYDLDGDGGLVPRGGRYLDPATAHAHATRIAHEGGT